LATRSPSADRPPLRRLRRFLRGVAPRTFQSRLTVSFVGVVALTLALVTIFVVNRLDDYFTRQQQAELRSRAGLVATYIDGMAADAARDAGGPVVDFETNVLNPAVIERFERDKKLIADLLAQADVDIVLGRPVADGGPFVPAAGGSLHVVNVAAPKEGQSRESVKADPVTITDVLTAYPFVIQVQLSNPHTFRQTAIANVTSLLAAVGIVALGLTIIVAAALAHRFTTPLRRLTEASRALAEGDLTKRVERADIRAGSSELAELAIQFNAMADRLEESVAIIRRDRDRSRDFLADVSHELRTPIAALLTFNELLSDQAGEDPVARAEFLDSSRVQLERLDWLAQNLLELSKLDSGLVLLDLRPDDLRAAVESAVEQANPAAVRRGVDLTLTLPSAPLRIRHDPQRVGQVVTNLVGNAIKFTPKGGAVEVIVAPYRDGARIDVSDTGTGIDASELPRIFERFYRGSRANEARGSGSGLGLAIVRSIVDMHGGSVTVDSRLGTGSRFSVFLPRDPRVEDAQPPSVPFGQDEASEARDVAPKMAETSPTQASRLNRESSG
jgi:signal transduction histidine kinase